LHMKAKMLRFYPEILPCGQKLLHTSTKILHM
jgi:hypothetical protein